MDDSKYKDDLKDIKEIMNRSSRFISLSGLSGVSAGIIALVAAWLAYETVYANQVYLGYKMVILTSQSITTLLVIATITIILTFGAVIFFTSREAKRNREELWDMQTKRLLINLFIPLVTGGILVLILLFKGYIGIVAPLTLIFYGLALVNASKYTLTEIRSLGLIEIILGLVAFNFIGYGLLFWSIGFGILHIIYGIAMYVKYK
jgi:hypothetical protein